jgi:hypothetical protein
MHHNSKDLTNKTFSDLTALYVVDKPSTVNTKNRGVWWMCKCTCGKEKIVCSTELTRKDTKSCGCMKKYYNNKLYKGVGLLPQSVYSHIQWGAKKRNIEFNVSKEYLWEKYESQKGKCYYTDLDIDLNTRNNKKTASIDRVDSSKGYIEGNIVWVHKNINIMKNVFSEKEFINYCKLIVDKHCPYDKNEKGNTSLRTSE